MKNEAVTVFNLICEDASHLGGPMGTEYTTHVFTKPFVSVEKAKEFAKKYQKKWPEHATWKRDGRNRLYCDATYYIWAIEKHIIK